MLENVLDIPVEGQRKEGMSCRKSRRDCTNAARTMMLRHRWGYPSLATLLGPKRPPDLPVGHELLQVPQWKPASGFLCFLPPCWTHSRGYCSHGSSSALSCPTSYCTKWRDGRCCGRKSSIPCSFPLQSSVKDNNPIFSVNYSNWVLMDVVGSFALL